MPGYVIHLAVAKRQIELDNIKNKEEFIRGVVAPDLLKQTGIDSHYGNSSNPDLKKFLENHKVKSDYNKGYFLHLVTDYMFYKKYLDRWSPKIYEDYNILNERLIKRYELIIPKEIKEYVKFEHKALTILNFDDIISFIETVGRIPINQMYKEYVGEKNYESQKQCNYI